MTFVNIGISFLPEPKLLAAGEERADVAAPEVESLSPF